MRGQPSMLPGQPQPLIIRSRRILTPAGPCAGAVLIKDGCIAAVLSDAQLPSAVASDLGSDVAVEDFGSAILMPGIIDPHVHCEDPGRTDWEGFEHATRAAAAGGITTLVDMPIDCVPVTTTPAAVAAKCSAAAGRCWVDLRLWGGLVPDNAAEMEALLDAGVAGVKAFLVHSGLDDFPNVGAAELAQAMPVLARRRRPLLAHAELPDAPMTTKLPSRRYADYEASRPVKWELDAIRLLIGLCQEHRCPVHIVHLSAAAALPMLAAARAQGLPITVETCPHYLTLAAEDIADGATHFKCAPPIRDRANREALWHGLRSGIIDMVACDHSPCIPGMRAADSGDFTAAWAGIAALQLSLPVLWTAAQERGFQPEQLVPWLCAAPARLAGIQAHKGAITPGRRADLVAWRPDASFRCEPARLFHRHPLTPYDGRTLFGEVVATWLGGHKIFASGGHCAPPLGRVLLDPPGAATPCPPPAAGSR